MTLYIRLSSLVEMMMHKSSSISCKRLVLSIASCLIFLSHCRLQYLDLPNLEPLVKHTFIRALFRLSGKSGRYPDSLVIRDIVLDSKAPMAAGQFGDVWKEEIEGHPIAVKAVRVYVKSEVDKIVKVR